MMNRRLRVLICGAIALCIASVSIGQEKSKDEWVTFTSKEGKFSVKVPGKPSEKKNAVTLGLEGSGNEFSIKWKDLDDKSVEGKTAEQLLKEHRDFQVKVYEKTARDLKASFTLDTDKSIKLGEVPGVEMKMLYKGFPFADSVALYHVRIYVVKNRVYELNVTAWYEFASSPIPQKLLDSFELSK